MQVYLRFSEVQPIFWACAASTKVSANRAKMQVYLRFSEVQPIFCVRVAYTKISANRAKIPNYPYANTVRPSRYVCACFLRALDLLSTLL